MPHALLKDFKSNLPLFVGMILAKLEAAAITYIRGKINEIIQKLLNQCPPERELQILLKTLDTIKNLMNKFDSQTAKLQKIPDSMEPAITAGKVLVEVLSHMPLPSTIGTPPGPAGGVIISVPTGVIQAQANTLVFARKMVETLGEDQKQIKGLLSSTAGIFDPIKSRIAMIEGLINRCIQDPNLSQEERDNILNSGGRTKNSDTSSRAGTQYTSTNGNTYTLSVIDDPNSAPIAPRRQAIAKDSRGIVVLKGNSSYAGDTKVLIDELKLVLDNLNSPPTGNVDTSNTLPIVTDIPTVDIDLSQYTPSTTNTEMPTVLEIPRQYVVVRGKDFYLVRFLMGHLQKAKPKVWNKVKQYLGKPDKGLVKINHPYVVKV